jgi:hypothetical protein
MTKELIKGGLGDGRPNNAFNKKQIRMGLKVEREHTTNPRIAREISKDHLTEFPDYYDYLGRMEKSMEKAWVCKGRYNKTGKHDLYTDLKGNKLCFYCGKKYVPRWNKPTGWKKESTRHRTAYYKGIQAKQKKIILYEKTAHENGLVGLWFENNRFIASVVGGTFIKNDQDYDVRGRIGDMEGKIDFKEIGYVGGRFSRIKENKERYIKSLERAFKSYGVDAVILQKK